MMQETAAEHRAVCHGCFRPSALCYCEFLTSVENRTPVVIVQHPHERFHPFGTARIAQRCLQNVHIEVDYNRSLRDGTRPIAIPDGAGLLYPGPDARDLATVAQHERPSALVVLDGTWHQARSLYRDIPALHRLPKFEFSPKQPSQYRIRKEPSLECVSTIEAIVHALGWLEPETPNLEEMLLAFDGMIDRQIETASARSRQPRFPRRQRPKNQGLPDALTEHIQRVVLVYGEAAFTGDEREIPSRHAYRRQPKELIHWTARRLRDDALFSEIISPTSLPHERRLCPTGLNLDDLRRGKSLADVRDAWQAFIAPDDLILSWNKSTLDIMRPLGSGQESDFLKGIYKNFARRRDRDCEVRGSIDDVIEREALTLRPPAFPGRAGRRLAQLEGLVGLMRESAKSTAKDPLETGEALPRAVASYL